MMWQAKKSGAVATVNRSVKIVKKDVDGDDGGSTVLSSLVDAVIVVVDVDVVVVDVTRR